MTPPQAPAPAADALATIAPDEFARLVAEHSPCDGGDSYGDPCCYWCQASVARYETSEQWTHRADCTWILLRRGLGMPTRVTLNDALHTYVGADDDG